MKVYYNLANEEDAQSLRDKFDLMQGDGRGFMKKIHAYTPFSYTHVFRLLRGKVRMTEGAYEIMKKAIEKIENSLTPKQEDIL